MKKINLSMKTNVTHEPWADVDLYVPTSRSASLDLHSHYVIQLSCGIYCQVCVSLNNFCIWSIFLQHKFGQVQPKNSTTTHTYVYVNYKSSPGKSM